MEISLWCCHTLIVVENGAFSHKIDYVTIFKEILNLKSYSDLAEWVDFAYWLSFSGEGPASAACTAGLLYSHSN